MLDSPQSPRITLRGIGLLSALGADAAETLAALRENESACFPDANGIPCGAIPDIDVQRWLGGPPGFIDRASLLMLVACAQALEHAALDPKTFPYGRFGVMAGTVWGGLQSASLFFRDAVEKGPRLVKPMVFPHTYGNTGASLAAMRWNLTGPHGCDMTGRVASGQAFAEAVASLRACHADTMLVVGAESLSPQRHAAVGHRPLGEAGAACVLTMEKASCSPQPCVLSARCGNNVATTCRAALAEANLAPAELGLVVSSACGCDATDRLEAVGLREILNDAPVPVIAPLNLCGELEGANAVFLVSVASLHLCHKPAPLATAATAALVVTTDPSGACFACVLELA